MEVAALLGFEESELTSENTKAVYKKYGFSGIDRVEQLTFDKPLKKNTPEFKAGNAISGNGDSVTKRVLK